jgi:hypothetical protein
MLKISGEKRTHGNLVGKPLLRQHRSQRREDNNIKTDIRDTVREN